MLRPPELNQASFWLGQGKINDRWFNSQALRRGPTGAMGTKRQAETGHGGMLAEKRDEQNRTVAETSNLGENKGLDRDPGYKEDASVLLPN